MAPYNQNSESTRGLWSQTASIDWCESNYELSYFIAEFWNTLSNLAFILPQLIQYIALARHKSVEQSFRLAYLSLALVGVGSFCFHLTLSRPMQMFDETSMILVSLHTFYLLYIIKNPKVDRQNLLIFLICYGLNFLCLYVFLVAWPVFHHTAFAVLLYASIAIGYQLKRMHGSHYKFWSVVTLQHLAFLFWLIDKHYCEVLTQFRDHHVPSLLRPAFQFHALWHLLMGLSSQLFICGLIRLRAWTIYREEFVINYGWCGLWIHLEKVTEVHSPLASLDKAKRLKKLDKQEQQQELDNSNYLHEIDNELKYRPNNNNNSSSNNNNNNNNNNKGKGAPSASLQLVGQRQLNDIDLNQNEVYRRLQ